MSNEELIAQARERIEGRIKSKKFDLKQLDEMQSALGPTNHDFETSRVTRTADLNILLTHLAEMDEHQAIEHCKNPLCPGPVCSKCGSKDTLEVPYPCNYLLTKAKRLLGVRSD